MIRNIVFDMGNVLIHDDMPAFAKSYANNGEEASLLLQELMYGPEWIEWDRGTLTIPQVADSVRKRLPEHLYPISIAILNNWHQAPKPIIGMKELIQELKEKGYRVYLLSNTSATYYQYRHLLPAIELFDGEFISADYQLLKPHKEIYEAFAKEFSLQAAECFFVDDKLENIEGAMVAGWTGHCFDKNLASLRKALQKAGVQMEE